MNINSDDLRFDDAPALFLRGETVKWPVSEQGLDGTSVTRASGEGFVLVH